MKNRITQRYEYTQYEVDYSFDEFREILNTIEKESKEMYENVDKFNICLASSGYSYDGVYLLITYERDETDEECIKRPINKNSTTNSILDLWYLQIWRNWLWM